MNLLIKKIAILLSLLLGTNMGVIAQTCWTGGIPATAAFATGGSGNYKDKILWLTWGTKTQAEVTNNPYGKHLVRIQDNDVSRARIDMGNGKFLCIEAKISNIVGPGIDDTGTNSGQVLNSETNIVGNGWQLNSYAPGNYSGDALDNLYNIGGTGTSNRLVSGIRNTRARANITFTITCTATLNGIPVRLPGMVLADAESMNSNLDNGIPREYITAEGNGVWNVIDMYKIKESGYYVTKSSVGGKNKIQFGEGNDGAGAVAAMVFNNSAYAANTQAVAFNVELKGGGGTALALGLLTPSIDGGDAPQSYGSPLHLIDDLKPVSDGIGTNKTNINVSSFIPGGFAPGSAGFLGTVYPDGYSGTQYSNDALGDDNSGSAGPNEEDAWPIALRSFSYKARYNIGSQISATIPYKPESGQGGFIYGWIDFNRNGKFDADEVATAPTSGNGTSVNLVWTVPSKRVVGSTYVRLRYVYDRPNQITSPSDLEQLATSMIVTNGEVEDTKIYIQGRAMVNPVLNSKGKK